MESPAGSIPAEMPRRCFLAEEPQKDVVRLSGSRVGVTGCSPTLSLSLSGIHSFIHSFIQQALVIPHLPGLHILQALAETQGQV